MKGEELQMEAMEAILSRRSIRRYTDEPISEKATQELLEAAMSAPSASNEQPWHFVIIDERQILDDIPQYHPYSAMLREAPLAIAVCGDLKRETMKGYWIQDCSAATENILIAAQAKDLGAVWLGVFPREERALAIQKLLGLPEHIIPLSLVSIGYPAEKKPRANRYDPSRIHHNRW
jgi:nitroreductase